MRKIAFVAILLAGCSSPVSVEDTTPQVCTDTRDGEQFTILPETVERATFTTNDVCFEVDDTTGRRRTLCKSHEAWLKCEPVKSANVKT